MANKRGRPSKNVLNQDNEVKITVSEDDVKKTKELHDIDLVEESKEMASEKFGVSKEDVKVDVVPEEPVAMEKEVVEEPEQPLVVEEPVVKEEVVEEKPKKKTLADLSTAELRRFQRTGKMPE
jgi:DNA primase